MEKLPYSSPALSLSLSLSQRDEVCVLSLYTLISAPVIFLKRESVGFTSSRYCYPSVCFCVCVSVSCEDVYHVFIRVQCELCDIHVFECLNAFFLFRFFVFFFKEGFEEVSIVSESSEIYMFERKSKYTFN